MDTATSSSEFVTRTNSATAASLDLRIKSTASSVVNPVVPSLLSEASRTMSSPLSDTNPKEGHGLATNSYLVQKLGDLNRARASDLISEEEFSQLRRNVFRHFLSYEW